MSGEAFSLFLSLFQSEKTVGLLLVSILIIELLLIVILTWIAMFLLASRNRSIATLRSIECALMSLQSRCAVKNSSLDKEEAGSIQETSNEGTSKALSS